MQLPFSHCSFVTGPAYRVKVKREVCLFNFLVASAKLAIWRTRKNRNLGEGTTDPVDVLKGMVGCRVKVEFAYYKLVNDVDSFLGIWALGGLLCEVDEEERLVLRL